MPDASNAIELGRPAADVFAFLADGTNDRQWRTGVLDVRLKSGYPRHLLAALLAERTREADDPDSRPDDAR